MATISRVSLVARADEADASGTSLPTTERLAPSVKSNNILERPEIFHSGTKKFDSYKPSQSITESDWKRVSRR